MLLGLSLHVHLPSVSVYCTWWSIPPCHHPSFPQDSPGVASHVPTHHSIAVLCMLSDLSKALVKNHGFLLIASVAFPSQPVCILCCLALNAKVDSKERIPVGSFRAVYLCLNSCGVLKKVTHSYLKHLLQI